MRLRNHYQEMVDTTLISGPTNLEINEDLNLIKVETAEQMFQGT